MELVIEILKGCPCQLKTFLINGVQGYQHDFGYSWDDGESAYPYYFCKNRHFKPIKPSDRVLNRYNITKEEYNTICQELTRKLHVGSCARCI